MPDVVKATPQAAPRMKGLPLTFLSKAPKRASHNGADGFLIPVRLTSYRSLPLSCIREIRLTLDGNPIAGESITFILDGHSYPLADLSDRTDLWWYILDFATLFFTLGAALEPGSHELKGWLTMIMPFATGGRITRTAHSQVHFTTDLETPA